MTSVLPLWRSLSGGALIGAGAAVLILYDGEVAGISGILNGILDWRLGTQAWRVAFLVGLLAPAAVAGVSAPTWQSEGLLLIVAGLLVGFGTRLGSGCTSGHGVCGLANLSVRSLIATVTFIATAMITVVAHHAFR